MSRLPIYYETRTVGEIDVSAQGPAFTYDPAWLKTRGAFPISVLMPLTTPRAPPQIFLPWAANLLPEASQLRTVGLRLGAAPEDVIGILAEIGRDTAGALSIAKPGHTGPGDWRPIPGDKALQRILDELPSKPFLVGDDGVSMSLAGVQTKLGVAIDSEGRLCVPTEGAPSTHILKPDSDKLFGGVQNEALCLRLARAVGINAPEVTTGKAGDRTYLLVTRYDRIRQGDRWRRLHQEDFCQALGKPPAAKYESNQSGIPGPTLAQMFALTRRRMRAPDILALLDYVIFNVLACNTDAHAKNYSLLISGRGVSLAPIYDIMCAAVWSNVTRNMAQKIAGKSRGEHLKRRHWQRFAADTGLNASRTIARVEILAKAVLAKTGATAKEVVALPAGDHPLMPKFVEALEARARAILSGLNDDSTSDEAAAVPATPPPKRSPRRAPTKRPKRPAASSKPRKAPPSP
ncbi:MAG: type II toxin-antitoxin system HipA family toxin [Hyphomicrobiaceae bacterium]